MKKIFIIYTLFSFYIIGNVQIKAQVTIGDDSQAPKGVALQIKPDNTTNNKGILFPRLALSGRTSYAPIATEPPTGTLVFNTEKVGAFPDELHPGLYWWDQGNKSWYPFAIDTDQYAAKFINQNTTTDLRFSSFTGVPLIGTLNFTDLPGLYEKINETTIQINQEGLYAFTYNLDMYAENRGDAIGIKLLLYKNGTALTNTTIRYAISQDNEEEFSHNFTEYIKVNDGDKIELRSINATNKDRSIHMRSSGTSSLTIIKVR